MVKKRGRFPGWSGLALAAGICACTNAQVSDDFNSPTLDPVWTFEDPLGDGSYAITGVGSGNALIELSVPAGQSHDNWTGGIETPRIVQDVADTDFEVEIRLDSTVTAAYQMQGILVEQDVNHFIRFDLFSDGSAVYAFAAMIDGGSVYVHVYSQVSIGAPVWLRVGRSGDTWTMQHSVNGSSWLTDGVFAQPLTVDRVGVAVGNYDGGGGPRRTPWCSTTSSTRLLRSFRRTAIPCR